MTENLPTIVHHYLDASTRRDREAVVRTFSPDATVGDEGHTYRGEDAIRVWLDGVWNVYSYTSQVTDVRREDADNWVVSLHLKGDFPGGEADLDQRFTVKDDRIAQLRSL